MLFITLRNNLIITQSGIQKLNITKKSSEELGMGKQFVDYTTLKSKAYVYPLSVVFL